MTENQARQIAEMSETVHSTSPFAERFAVIERDLQVATSIADQAVAAETQARLEFEKEATGNPGGTGMPGEGPETQRAREQYAQATVQVQQTQADLVAARDRAASAQAALNTAIAAEIADRAAEIAADDGLLTRLEALDDVFADSTTLTVIRWWLTMTVILVFLVPLFLSLSIPRRRQATLSPVTA